MDLLANDLSIHGQFHDTVSFRDAFTRLMAIRAVARRFDREVHCHRMLLAAEPMPDVPMQRALQRFPMDERRAAMRWLTHGGPFWDDHRQHGVADYLECRGDLVTDHAVGEAAYRTLHDMECALVSLAPSDWDFSPVEVAWRRADEGLDDRTVALANWRDAAALASVMAAAAAIPRQMNVAASQAPSATNTTGGVTVPPAPTLVSSPSVHQASPQPTRPPAALPNMAMMPRSNARPA